MVMSPRLLSHLLKDQSHYRMSIEDAYFFWKKLKIGREIVGKVDLGKSLQKELIIKIKRWIILFILEVRISVKCLKAPLWYWE